MDDKAFPAGAGIFLGCNPKLKISDVIILGKFENLIGGEMKYRNWIVPVFMVIAIGGAFFVPSDWVIPWVLGWAGSGAGLTNWVFPAPKQSRDYRPDKGYVTVHYDCTLPLKLTNPSGMSIGFVIEDHKKLRVYDSKSDDLGLLIFFTFKNLNLEVGKLSIIRQARAGYRIEWPKGEVWRVE